VRGVEIEKGYFGQFGGSFVFPELQEVLDYLAEQFKRYKDDPEFKQEYLYYLREYVGRENPLTYA
jgi:tryptophan synthase beta chain